MLGDKSPGSDQVNRLKIKLKHANAKIVELLEEKCVGYRQR